MAREEQIRTDIFLSFTRKHGPSLPKNESVIGQIEKRIDELVKTLYSDELTIYILTKNKGHDSVSYDHMLRVGVYFDFITQKNNELVCSIPQQTLEVVGFIHDAGKMYIPDEVLKKPTKLADDEFEIMKCHNMLSITLLKQLESKYPGISEISIEHHPYPRTGNERRDDERRTMLFDIDFDRRNGERREGERRKHSPDIRRAGQILAICDIFDALSSPRAYKKPWSRHAVSAELESRFDGYKKIVQELYINFPRNF